jgi:hypothetical protein
MGLITRTIAIILFLGISIFLFPDYLYGQQAERNPSPSFNSGRGDFRASPSATTIRSQETMNISRNQLQRVGDNPERRTHVDTVMSAVYDRHIREYQEATRLAGPQPPPSIDSNKEDKNTKWEETRPKTNLEQVGGSTASCRGEDGHYANINIDGKTIYNLRGSAEEQGRQAEQLLIRNIDFVHPALQALTGQKPGPNGVVLITKPGTQENGGLGAGLIFHPNGAVDKLSIVYGIREIGIDGKKNW